VVDTYRVAVVQLDYVPAFRMDGREYILFDSLPNLSSPDSMSVGNPDVAKVDRIADRVNDARWRAWEGLVYESYLEHLVAKLGLVLRYCVDRGARLIVLPEYSVPAEALPAVLSSAPNAIVFAGTHTVSSADAATYAQIGVSITAKDSGKAICPVLRPGGRSTRVEKMAPSQLETYMKEGESWQPIELERAPDGLDASVACLICSDFLSLPGQARTYLEGSEAVPHLVLVVPAHTPTDARTADLEISVESVLEARLKRSDHRALLLLANAAAYGGTRVAFHNTDKNPLPGTTPLGYEPMGRHQEGILLCDLSQAAWLTTGGGFPSLTRVPFPFAPFERIPLVYRDLRSAALAFLERLRNSNGKGTAELPTEYAACRAELPLMLTEKLDELYHARRPDAAEAARRRSFCDMGSLSTTAEWKLQVAMGTSNALHALLQSLSGGLREQIAFLAQRCGQATLQAAERRGVSWLPEAVADMDEGSLLTPTMSRAIRVLRETSSGQVEARLAREVQHLASVPEDGRASLLAADQLADVVSGVRPFPAVRLATTLHKAVEGGQTAAQIRALVAQHLATAEAQAKRLVETARRLPLIQSTTRVLLFGYSACIVAVLGASERRLKEAIQLYVAECPNRLGEDSGPVQIRQLRAMGYRNVWFVPHPSLFRCLEERSVNLVLMGANLASRTYAVNTVGSRIVIEAAATLRIPVVIVCTTQNIWPDQVLTELEIGKLLARQQRPKWTRQWDIAQSDPWVASDTVVSFAYDKVPASRGYAILTEEGLLGTQREEQR
jgi:translation initiation factor 2B subunit (eIF-2B alpha/beta/delta family)/predicted amidohydrolase